MRLWLLLSLFVVFLSSKNLVAGELSEAKKVILYLQLHEDNDEAFPNPEIAFTIYRQTMLKNFPERSVRRIIAPNKVILQQQLYECLVDDEKISHLFVRAHGKSWGTKEVAGIRFALGPRLGPDKKREYLEISEHSRDFAVVQGIHGRFTSDSQIIAESCYIFQGDEEVAKKKAAIFQRFLGQTDGYIYGNRTAGNAHTSGERHQPLFFSKNWHLGLLGGGLGGGLFFLANLSRACPSKAGALSLAAAASALVGGTYREIAKYLAIVSDQYNKGYKITTQRSNIVSIEADRFINFKARSMQSQNRRPQEGRIAAAFAMGPSLGLSLTFLAGDSACGEGSVVNITNVMDLFNH